MAQALKCNILPGRCLSISGSDSPSCHYAWWTVNSWVLCHCLQNLKAISLPLQITLRCCYSCIDALYEKSRVWGCKSPPNVLLQLLVCALSKEHESWNLVCTNVLLSLRMRQLMLSAWAAPRCISPCVDLQQVITLMEAGYFRIWAMVKP